MSKLKALFQGCIYIALRVGNVTLAERRRVIQGIMSRDLCEAERPLAVVRQELPHSFISHRQILASGLFLRALAFPQIYHKLPSWHIVAVQEPTVYLIDVGVAPCAVRYVRGRDMRSRRECNVAF